MTCDYNHNPVPSHKWMVFKDSLILNSLLYTYMTWHRCYKLNTRLPLLDSVYTSVSPAQYPPGITFNWMILQRTICSANARSILSFNVVKWPNPWPWSNHDPKPESTILICLSFTHILTIAYFPNLNHPVIGTEHNLHTEHNNRPISTFDVDFKDVGFWRPTRYI